MIRKLAFSCLALVLAWSELAWAESAAEQAFRAGEQAFAKNDYVKALDEFRRAFREDPRDAVRFNIGVCLERLGRFKEAVAEYESAAASQDLDATKRERARTESARVRGRLASIDARSDAVGATLFVDGAKVCELPCKVELDPRTHSVVARTSRREETKSVTLESGEVKELAFALSVRAQPKKPAPKPAQQKPGTRSNGPGVLTWIGGGMAIVGTAGFIGFGLRARSLEDDYDANPTASTRDDGVRMQTLTNVSLGVALTGVALVAVDLLFIAPAKKSEKQARNSLSGGVRF